MTTEQNMRRLLKVVQILQVEHPRMSVGQAAAFLAVCADEGKTMTEYAKSLEIPEGTISRNLLDLGPRKRTKENGFQLMLRENDPKDIRRFFYQLSPTGRDLRTHLNKVLG